jgi:hypothetical protein
MKMKLNHTNLTSRWLPIGTILYVLIFLAVRLTNLTLLPLLVDEGRHIARARVTFAGGNLFLGMRESMKQLYIWIVALFIPFFSDHLLAARIVSVLAGLGGAWVCYKLATMLYPERRLGYIAALFYLLCPFSLFYDRVALTDSLLTMLMGLSIVLSFQFWRSPSLKWAVALGSVFALAVLNKAYALLYYPTPFLLWLFLKRELSLSRFIRLMAVVYGVTLLAWLPILIIGLQAYWNDHIEKLAASSPADSYLDTLRHNIISVLDWLQIFLTWPYLLVLLFVLVLIIFRRDKIGFILILLALTPVLVFTFALHAWSPRYILPIVTPISVLVALGIADLTELALRLLGRVRSQPSLSPPGLQPAIFLLFSIPALLFSYLIIFKPSQAPLPGPDKLTYIEGRFSGYGLRESAQVVDEFAARYPKIIVLQGANLMDAIFSLDVIGMMFYMSNSDKVQVQTIAQFDENTFHTLDAYAQAAPTFTLNTTETGNSSNFVFSDLVNFPQAWQLASLPKPGGQFKVTLYQWLLPPDFALRWFQQGGDPDPQVAWRASNTLVTTQGGKLIDWSQTAGAAPETLQIALTGADVEYLLVEPQLISSRPELFAPFITTDGTRLFLNQLPPNWWLAFAYPDIQCQWCLLQLRPPNHPTQITFNDQIELAGYDLSATQLAAGEPLYLTLYWHSLQPASEPYVIFTHLIDANGNRVAQVDEPPLQGKWPINNWRVGDRLADRHFLEIGSTLPAGDYTLLAGLYHPTSLERVPVDAGQHSIVDNSVVLTNITVK